MFTMTTCTYVPALRTLLQHTALFRRIYTDTIHNNKDFYINTARTIRIAHQECQFESGIRDANYQCNMICGGVLREHCL